MPGKSSTDVAGFRHALILLGAIGFVLAWKTSDSIENVTSTSTFFDAFIPVLGPILGCTSVALSPERAAQVFSGLEGELPYLNIVTCPGLNDKEINPYTWLTYAPMRAFGGVIREFSFYRPPPPKTDVLHIHWPEKIFWGRISRQHPYVARLYAARMLDFMDRVRKGGGIVVWTAHNIRPHESLDRAREEIWKDFIEKFISKVDLVINLSPEAAESVKAAYPSVKLLDSAIIPHPHYRTVYPPRMDRHEARQALSVPDEAFLLATIGSIRASKGISELARVFARIAQPEEKLLIAGACADPAYLDELRDLEAASNGAIILSPTHLSNDDMAAMLSATDLSVMNFRSILNSGSVILSLSYNVPVCAPNSGSLKSLHDRLGSRWFLPMEQPISGDSLREALDTARIVHAGPEDVVSLGELDPEAISRQLYQEYSRVLSARRSTQLIKTF
jgi:beta-1,4-mannosyltransferase